MAAWIPVSEVAATRFFFCAGALGMRARSGPAGRGGREASGLGQAEQAVHPLQGAAGRALRGLDRTSAPQHPIDHGSSSDAASGGKEPYINTTGDEHTATEANTLLYNTSGH